MKIAMIGLGKMGGNMSRRLIAAGHQVVGYNLHREVTDQLAEEVGLIPAYSLEEVVSKFEDKRLIWIMVPSGDPVESTVTALKGLLSADDIVIDGGNSNFNQTMRRAELLAENGIELVDVGVSGGVWGLEGGYSMMVGGKTEPFLGSTS